CAVSGISAPETCFVGDEDDITITGNCLDGVGFPDIPGSTTVSSTEEKNAEGHIVKITRRVQWTTPGEHTLSATCGESSASTTVKVYKVDIEWNDQIVTDGTVPRIVGQPIVLKAKIEPAPPAETTYRWSVPDKCIKNYEMLPTLEKIDASIGRLDGNCRTRATEEPLELVDLKLPSVSFFAKGIPVNAAAMVTAQINGRHKSAETALVISRPSASLGIEMSTIEPPADIIRIVGNKMCCGRTNTSEPESRSAVRLTAEVTVPEGGAGEIAIIQRINTSRLTTAERIINGVKEPYGTPMTTNGQYVLDRAPAASAVAIPQFMSLIISASSNQAVCIYTLDSPSVEFIGVDTLIDVREYFEDFLMYRPTGGIWVTLRKARWKWAARANRENGGALQWNWLVKTPPSVETSPTGDSEQLPTWTQRIQDIDYFHRHP
ncbi:hypothetical protein, partial [Planctopirus hydrillae]|uniref:hypothetical protein n=1 Tax=Planctopirus hydrillae TaxID=1841610 RepID=UPI0013F4C5C6